MSFRCILYISVHNEASLQARGLHQIGFSSDPPVSRFSAVPEAVSPPALIRTLAAASPSAVAGVRTRIASPGKPIRCKSSSHCCKLKSSKVKRRPALRGRSGDYTGEKGVFAELEDI